MTTTAQVYASENQVQLMHDVVSDGTDTEIYSIKFNAADVERFNAQFEWDETSATYAATITLWATDYADPSEVDNTDWVEMTADHGFDGVPNPPTGGDGSAMVDVSANAALWYRFMIARDGGAATVNILLSKKKSL